MDTLETSAGQEPTLIATEGAVALMAVVTEGSPDTVRGRAIPTVDVVFTSRCLDCGQAERRDSTNLWRYSWEVVSASPNFASTGWGKWAREHPAECSGRARPSARREREDPRALVIAQSRQRIAHEADRSTANWEDLEPNEQKVLVDEAATWLRAAAEAGIVPLAERPTRDHYAVYLDEWGYLWGEYDGDDILRLVQVSEQAQSKKLLEEQGSDFRLIGWHQ